MTRTGKIARLPYRIRDQLNRRLQDGEPGTRLVEWLNALPAVQEILAAEFGGRPINEQNLSEWRQGGYRDWERHEETRAWVRELADDTDDLAEEAKGMEVSHRLGTVLAVELARLAETLLQGAADPEERWQRLREVLRELTQLRQEDRKAGWLALERARYEESVDQREAEEGQREIARMKKRLLAPVWAQIRLGPLAEIFGGGDAGNEIAACILEVQHELPAGTLKAKRGSKEIKPDQAESNPVKPAPSPGRETS